MIHVYIFRRSVAERKQEAKSVIRKKGKWFSSGIQITLHDPRITTARAPPMWAGLVISVCRAHAAAILSCLHLGVGGQTKQNPVPGYELSIPFTNILSLLLRNSEATEATPTLKEHEEMRNSQEMSTLCARMNLGRCPRELSMHSQGTDGLHEIT